MRSRAAATGAEGAEAQRQGRREQRRAAGLTKLQPLAQPILKLRNVFLGHKRCNFLPPIGAVQLQPLIRQYLKVCRQCLCRVAPPVGSTDQSAAAVSAAVSACLWSGCGPAGHKGWAAQTLSSKLP